MIIEIVDDKIESKKEEIVLNSLKVHPKPRYFPRGDGPLVSIMLATRGRPGWAAASIDSYYSLARKPSEIEFILRIDDDDTPTIEMYEKLKTLPINIKAIIGPRGKGYLDMHKFVNEMSFMSTGDWIQIANDDARMMTQNWDEVLDDALIIDESPWHRCTDVINFLCITQNRPDATEFSFLRRKVINILGHYSLNPHNDTWAISVLCSVSSTFKVPIYFYHPSDEIEDVVRKEGQAAYKISGADLNTCEAYRQKATDVLKLVDHIENWQKEHNCFREIVNK